MDQTAYLTGQFLLAMPGIGDPRFDQAVIAMCAHDAQGAIGIGLGATYDGLGFHDLLRQFDIEPGEAPDAPVHIGGPVEPRRGFVLHSADWGRAGHDRRRRPLGAVRHDRRAQGDRRRARVPAAG